MRVEFSTDTLSIIVPDTYGSNFQYEPIKSWDDFKQLMIDKAEQYINDAIMETDFASAELRMGVFGSPKYYNYRTDYINFTLEFDDILLDIIKEKVNDQFFEYAKKYRSYDGFISFYPYERNKFFTALNGKGRQDLAIAMFIEWQLSQRMNMNAYQQDYLDEVWNHAKENRYLVYEEEN